jgi:hypothetical protein
MLASVRQGGPALAGEEDAKRESDECVAVGA